MTDPTLTRLLLIRHGETHWSRGGRHTGWTDVPLAPEGTRQAERLRARLAAAPVVRVLSSPLSRALETCRIAGFGDRAIVDPDLREWNYGAFEGMTTDEIRRQIAGWTIWAGPVPGGETAEAVGSRVDRVLASVNDAGGDVAIFAHGHVLRVLAARWLDLAPVDGALFELATATISRLGWERERRVIEVWNDGCHIGG